MTERPAKAVEDLTALDTACRRAADRVARVTGRREVKNALSGTWLGHPLHPVLSDIPIGAWVMASLTDATAGARGAGAARLLVGAGLVAAAPTVAAGTSDWSDTYGATQRVGLVHGVCNGTATVLQVVSWVVRRRGHHDKGAVFSGVELDLTLSAACLGGHLSFVRGVGVKPHRVPGGGRGLDGCGGRVGPGGTTSRSVRSRGEFPWCWSGTTGRCTRFRRPARTLADHWTKASSSWEAAFAAPGTAARSVSRTGRWCGPASVAQPCWDVKVEAGRLHVRARTVA